MAAQLYAVSIAARAQSSPTAGRGGKDDLAVAGAIPIRGDPGDIPVHPVDDRPVCKSG